MAREIYKKWAEESENDFTAGKVLHKSEIYNIAVFHFQQAVEKKLKACLYFYDQQPWGHSIFKLIQHIVEINNRFMSILDDSRELDMHYTSTRYPDALPGLSPSELYNQETSERLKQKAKKIIDFIDNEMEKKLEGE